MNRIQLKNVKRAEFASEETHCYSATVYFDGKRVGTVKNDGHGGCDYQYPEDREAWDEMGKYIATLPEITTTFGGEAAFTYLQDLEGICCDLVNDWLVDKDLKSLLRRKFVWQKEDGSVYECTRRKEHTVQGMVEVIAKTEPTSKLLNAMPIEQAREIYRAI